MKSSTPVLSLNHRLRVDHPEARSWFNDESLIDRNRCYGRMLYTDVPLPYQLLPKRLLSYCFLVADVFARCDDIMCEKATRLHVMHSIVRAYSTFDPCIGQHLSSFQQIVAKNNGQPRSSIEANHLQLMIERSTSSLLHPILRITIITSERLYDASSNVSRNVD